MKISNFSYTVHADGAFMDKLQDFLFTLKLYIFNFNTLTNTYSYKVNMDSYIEDYLKGFDGLLHLREEIKTVTKVILSVQVLEDNQYKISYFDIGKEIVLEDSKKINKGVGYSDSMKFYRMILNNEIVLSRELKSLKKTTEFVLTKDPAVTTTINSIELLSQFHDQKDGSSPTKRAGDVFKETTLSQLIENDGDHLTYKMYKANVDENVYTLPVVKYKAIITDPQKIVNLFHIKKSQPLQDISNMTESEVLNALSYIIRQKLKSTKKQVSIKRDTVNGYYVVADESCRKSWVAPINTKDGVALRFGPLFESDTNFASLSTVKEKYDLKFYKCEGNITATEYKKMKDKSDVTISNEICLRDGKGKELKKIPATYTTGYNRDTLNVKTQYFATLHINNFIKDNGTSYTLLEMSDLAFYISKVAADYVVGNYKGTYYEESNPEATIPLIIHDELQNNIKSCFKVEDLGVGGYSFMNDFHVKLNAISWELKKVI